MRAGKFALMVPRELRQARDVALDLSLRGHHQVGKFIDNDHDVRQGPRRGLRLGAIRDQAGQVLLLHDRPRVVALDIAHARACK